MSKKLTLGDLSLNDFFAFILDPSSPYYGFINKDKIYPLIEKVLLSLYIDKNQSSGITPGIMKSYDLASNDFAEIAWRGYGYIHVSANSATTEQNISFEIKLRKTEGMQVGNTLKLGTRVRAYGEYDLPFFVETSDVQQAVSTLDILIDFATPPAEITVTWFCNDFRVFGIL